MLGKVAPHQKIFLNYGRSASWTNNGLNFTGFGSAQSDALIDSINISVNETKRIELSKRFQKLVYDEQPSNTNVKC